MKTYKLETKTTKKPVDIALLNTLKEAIKGLKHTDELAGMIRKAIAEIRDRRKSNETVYVLTHKSGEKYESTSIRHAKKNLLKELREKRSAVKTRTSESKRGHKILGMVHVNPNDYLNDAYKSRKKRVFEEKKPTDRTKNYLGIELEFISKFNRDDLALKLCLAGLASYVCLKGDGSIRTESPYQYAHEICVLASEAEYKSIIAKVTAIISIDGKVNDSCGYHAHIDMRSRDKDKAYTRLLSAQDLLYSMVPNSRELNSYCKKQTHLNVDTASNSSDRYFGINACSLQKHSTIEVRIHSGTIDSAKVNNWIELLLSIVDETPRSEALNEYISKRVSKFNERQVA